MPPGTAAEIAVAGAYLSASGAVVVTAELQGAEVTVAGQRAHSGVQNLHR